MSNGIKIPTVREYISPQDSTTILDYFVNELGFPQDIHQIYSEEVAPMPINFQFSDYLREQEEATGLTVRVPLGSELYEGVTENAHTAIDTLIGKNWVGTGGNVPYTSNILIDSLSAPAMGTPSLDVVKELEKHGVDYEDIRGIKYQNWKNTLIHEALGHVLPERIYGYKPKGGEKAELSGRGELLANLIQTMGGEDVEKNIDFRAILEPIVKKQINYQQPLNLNLDKRGFSILDRIKNWFGY